MAYGLIISAIIFSATDIPVLSGSQQFPHLSLARRASRSIYTVYFVQVFATRAFGCARHGATASPQSQTISALRSPGCHSASGSLKHLPITSPSSSSSASSARPACKTSAYTLNHEPQAPAKLEPRRLPARPFGACRSRYSSCARPGTRGRPRA